MAKAKKAEVEQRKGEIILFVNEAFDKGEKCPTLDEIAGWLNEKFHIESSLQKQNVFQYLKKMDDDGEIIYNLFRSEIVTDHIIETRVNRHIESVTVNLERGFFEYKKEDESLRWLLKVQRYSIERYLNIYSDPLIDSLIYDLSEIIPEYITLAALMAEIDDGILGLSKGRIIKEDNRLDNEENNPAEIIGRLTFSFQKLYRCSCPFVAFEWLFHYVFENSERIDVHDPIALEEKIDEILLQSLEKGLIIENSDREYCSLLKVNNESFYNEFVLNFISDEFDRTDKPVEYDRILSVLFRKCIEDESQLVKDILNGLKSAKQIREDRENQYVPSYAQEEKSDVGVEMENTVNKLYDKLKKFPAFNDIAEELKMPVQFVEFILEQFPEIFTIKDGNRVLTGYIKEEYNKQLAPVDTVSLPIYGRISCGEADEQRQEPTGFYRCPIEIDGEKILDVRKSYYVLKTYGDSMIKAGINDGDYILIEECPGADPYSLVNKVVVAKDQDEGTTLKRVKRDSDGKLCLHAENDEIVNGERRYPDMYKSKIEVQGIWTEQFIWKNIKNI